MIGEAIDGMLESAEDGDRELALEYLLGTRKPSGSRSAIRFLQRTALYSRSRWRRNGPPLGYGAKTMPKELKNKREEKKKAAMTPKEKKAAKRSKKAAHAGTST